MRFCEELLGWKISRLIQMENASKAPQCHVEHVLFRRRKIYSLDTTKPNGIML